MSSKGPVKWLSGERCLSPDLTLSSTVGSTQWEGRTYAPESCLMISTCTLWYAHTHKNVRTLVDTGTQTLVDTHTHTHVHTYTHTQNRKFSQATVTSKCQNQDVYQEPLCAVLSPTHCFPVVCIKLQRARQAEVLDTEGYEG